jgi:hypothetical protein
MHITAPLTCAVERQHAAVGARQLRHSTVRRVSPLGVWADHEEQPSARHRLQVDVADEVWVGRVRGRGVVGQGVGAGQAGAGRGAAAGKAGEGGSEDAADAEHAGVAVRVVPGVLLRPWRGV